MAAGAMGYIRFLASFAMIGLIVSTLMLVDSASGTPFGGLQSARLSPRPQPHSLSKRSFFDIECKGTYDKAIFAKLDRICLDCYNQYPKNPEVYILCRFSIS